MLETALARRKAEAKVLLMTYLNHIRMLTYLLVENGLLVLLDAALGGREP